MPGFQQTSGNKLHAAASATAILALVLAGPWEQTARAQNGQ
jgi:hypothetical protein